MTYDVTIVTTTMPGEKANAHATEKDERTISITNVNAAAAKVWIDSAMKDEGMVSFKVEAHRG